MRSSSLLLLALAACGPDQFTVIGPSVDDSGKDPDQTSPLDAQGGETSEGDSGLDAREAGEDSSTQDSGVKDSGVIDTGVDANMCKPLTVLCGNYPGDGNWYTDCCSNKCVMDQQQTFRCVP